VIVLLARGGDFSRHAVEVNQATLVMFARRCHTAGHSMAADLGKCLTTFQRRPRQDGVRLHLPSNIPLIKAGGITWQVGQGPYGQAVCRIRWF